MPRMRALLATLLFSAACSAAAADQARPSSPPGAPMPLIALANAPAKARAPYDVQIIREGGDMLPTYQLGNRFYVQGSVGERYVIRVTNPTARRVEAVVSVDGIDVVDGQDGDLAKRGYIVPPYGETNIEGFRTSTDDVATFRFSSVDGSYAGKQGKARNVGVIAVAVFEEVAQPAEQQIVGNAAPPPTDGTGNYDYRGDLDPDVPRNGNPPSMQHRSVDKTKDSAGPAADAAPTTTTTAHARPVPPPPPAPAGITGGYGGRASSPPAAKAARERSVEADDEGGAAQEKAPTNRLGLGTEFGEQRYSSVNFVRFVRAAGRPVAIAELRYNDGAGLTALGINVQPLPDGNEIMQRETADPFPGTDHFAMPPH